MSEIGFVAQPLRPFGYADLYRGTPADVFACCHCSSPLSLSFWLYPSNKSLSCGLPCLMYDWKEIVGLEGVKGSFSHDSKVQNICEL